MHTALMALTSYEASVIVANSPKEPVGGMAKTAEASRPDDRWEETELVANDHLSWKVLFFWSFKLGSNDGNPTCRAVRKS